MNKKSKIITCKDCPFYTGIQCHGHGEYWGECTLLNQAYKILEKRAGRKHYISTDFRDVCYDDSECIFLKWSIYELKKI